MKTSRGGVARAGKLGSLKIKGTRKRRTVELLLFLHLTCTPSSLAPTMRFLLESPQNGSPTTRKETSSSFAVMLMSVSDPFTSRSAKTTSLPKKASYRGGVSVGQRAQSAERSAHARDTGIPRRNVVQYICLLYTSPSPRDRTRSRMPSSA